MNLSEKLIALHEEIKYTKHSVGDVSYALEAKSKYGDVVLSVASDVQGKDHYDVVYAISVGDEDIFDAMENQDSLNWNNGAISLPDAKDYVARYLKAQKFNPEKWLKSSKEVEAMLLAIDNKKVSSLSKLQSSAVGKTIVHIADTVSNLHMETIPAFASSIVVNFLKTPKAKQIIFSKISRLAKSNRGFYSGFTELISDNHDKSLDKITDKAISRLLTKQGKLKNDPDEDFFVAMFNAVPLEDDIRKKLKQQRNK